MVDCFWYREQRHTCKTGHIIKGFPLFKIESNIKTTIAEEAAFSNPQHPEDYAKAGTAVAAIPEDISPSFGVGDQLKVVEGQLRGMLGTVVKVLENYSLLIQPNMSNAPGGMVTMDPRKCVPFFCVGD